MGTHVKYLSNGKYLLDLHCGMLLSYKVSHMRFRKSISRPGLETLHVNLM